MQRLIVKNFGPLKDIDIELKSFNLIIGENGSGKSILGKLITILKNNCKNEEKVLSKFKEYELLSYFKENSEISFFCYDSKIRYNITKNEVNIFFREEKEEETDFNDIYPSRYIPAERNILSLFSKDFNPSVIPEAHLPKYLFEFISQYELAKKELKELDFLDYKYKLEDGEDKLFYGENKDKFIHLNKSSTGLRAIFPLFLTIEYFYKNNTSDFIIEEPELNLFPCIQYEFIKFITSKLNQDLDSDKIIDNSSSKMITIITHSPYVISSFNNLLFAYKVGKINPEGKRLVNDLIKEEHWINPKYLTANYLKNGVDKNIMNKGGLISESEITIANGDVSYKFDDILERI